MQDRDAAICLIKNELLRENDCVELYHSAIERAQHSYIKSTYKDLIRLLSQDSDNSPIDIIYNYMNKMEDYACENPFSSFIFSVSRDASEYILDKLLLLGGK